MTVRVCEAEVPSTVLPAAVRVELGLARVSPPVKVARPELSRVKRSTGCPLLLLVLPAALVLNTRLPPVLPVASCEPAQQVESTFIIHYSQGPLITWNRKA